MKLYTLPVVLVVLLGGCREVANTLKKNEQIVREEQMHTQDWLDAWDMCSGYLARKKDGTLWEFGEIGNCNWGEIQPVSFDENNTKHYTYYKKGKKIAEGFNDAKIINEGYLFYAIKKDGTLWHKSAYHKIELSQIGKDTDWLTAGSKYEGNGCSHFEIGLKKDGSLWNLDENKIKRIGNEKDFTEVAFGCDALFAQKSNGEIFLSYTNDLSNLKKFIPNSKSDVYEKEALLKLRDLKLEIGGNHSDFGSKKLNLDKLIRKDGTLSLPPKIGG